jgi:hypothetical protein
MAATRALRSAILVAFTASLIFMSCSCRVVSTTTVNHMGVTITNPFTNIFGKAETRSLQKQKAGRNQQQQRKRFRKVPRSHRIPHAVAHAYEEQNYAHDHRYARQPAQPCASQPSPNE